MTIQCSVCRNHVQSMYCAHCINTSPNLLHPLRMQLLMVQQKNKVLKGKVEDILSHALDKNWKSSDNDTEGIILADRLHKLEVLKRTKRNNRVRYRISQLTKRIENKQQRLQSLRLQITTTDVAKVSNANKKEIEEIRTKYLQLNEVVKREQELECQSLVDWFILRKRNSYEIPYTLVFLPVVSLKNFHKLPKAVTISSLHKMFQFLEIYSQIISFPLLYKGDEIKEKTINTDEEIAKLITKLVINVLQIGRFKNLIPKDAIDLVWLLDQYDVDSLFYNVIVNHKMECRVVLFHWTFGKVSKVVTETLQLPAGSTTSFPRQQVGDTYDKDDDMWHIVG
ncbi:hypothetical protein Kpol_534p20 [Vanderwaltozyma polyspora DSM 70294]|uniref:Autophagy-related protein 14 n=1 Tax=Vanderwaltozyma polyspora (strain ATCC 22028 / DSM 70294 / BCRC 21397 / CBS 2163 / NBRC 10782 / NRRL Y-8283 / UCD 57-17) TaxID=436907 RepID=ATG14_VANPO|nr:uncharacterized protein Kpol_534p20 [Vanderwaltozyma polyspora DSM 70294]A7TJJ8.1 RecName: Full=Autophagy-related protein 14 [Vanderwaltozyma polyspora DSM 70294]EDO17541.1 hypothetical protein Kpol_534p20 [Vanderwaltozyma polyspora DSM 70294]